LATHVRYDVLVLGGGSAGCVLAARLSEDPERSVCLVGRARGAAEARPPSHDVDRRDARDLLPPVGTCSEAVGDDLRVRGFENLYVCDASVFETIPRANTHLPTLALAEKLGSEL